MKIQRFSLLGIRGLNLVEKKGEYHEPIAQEYFTSDINVFIGRNGAGKSTVIDAIDSLRDVRKLALLKRENTHENHLCKLQLEIDGAWINLTFKNSGLLDDVFAWGMKQVIEIIAPEPEGYPLRSRFLSEKYEISEGLQKTAKETLRTWGSCIHYYLPVEAEHLDLDLWAKEICALSSGLHGMTSANLEKAWERYDEIEPYDLVKVPPVFISPVFFQVHKERLFANLRFADDPEQPSWVPYELIPSGWKAYLQIVLWLGSLPKGSVALLEEPETHLHHDFQRRLSLRIQQIAMERDLQLFIATHSPVFISMQPSKDVSVSVFEAVEEGLRLIQSPDQLLDELGILASDVLLPNGVVWVEGPSDRIYLNHWIRSYCDFKRIEAPQERCHFSILPYGGSSLAHYDAPSTAEAGLISLFSLSHNAFVLMDKDLDFDELGMGSGAKQRIKDSLRDDVWVTDGPTIESYLPREFFDKYFSELDSGRVKGKSSLSKVEIARRYVREFQHWPSTPSPHLERCIEALVERIRRWNRG